MMGAHNDYYEALYRLFDNRPELVPKGTKISKDSVALEAGRKRGSIKASRASQAGLVADIEAYSLRQQPVTKNAADKVKKLKEEIAELENKYLKSLNREVMLTLRVRELEEIIDSSNVKVLRKGK